MYDRTWSTHLSPQTGSVCLPVVCPDSKIGSFSACIKKAMEWVSSYCRDSSG